MRRIIVIGALTVALLAVGWTALARLGGGPNLPWSGPASGGGTSSGDRFTLSGSISQPDASDEMTGGNFTLQGGFQAGAPDPRPLVCGDQDRSGVVDVFDVILIMQLVVGLAEPTEEQLSRINVVRDEGLNILDVVLLLQHVVGSGKIQGCGPAAPAMRVEEVPNPIITAEDPILQGERLDPVEVLGQFPDPPEEFRHRGAHDLFEETDWTFAEEVQVGPGQAQATTVSFTEPVLLQARATWFGALVPMEMTVTMDEALLGTGAAHPSPPNRGAITADVEIDSPGTATVTVVNNGSVPVGVQMMVGVLPLSLRP